MVIIKCGRPSLMRLLTSDMLQEIIRLCADHEIAISVEDDTVDILGLSILDPSSAARVAERLVIELLKESPDFDFKMESCFSTYVSRSIYIFVGFLVRGPPIN